MQDAEDLWLSWPTVPLRGVREWVVTRNPAVASVRDEGSNAGAELWVGMLRTSEPPCEKKCEPH